VKILVTGAGGMLGVDLTTRLRAEPGVTVTAATRADLDIRDAQAVIAAVGGHDLVINTAAYTNVDAAESDEHAATEINAVAAGHVAGACAATGARLIQLSTDYVLPGQPDEPATPWREDAPTGPVNAYGRSKLAGERAVLSALPETGYVVRTAWLYGPHGRNFVSTILRLAGEKESLDVVDDQVGQPTWTVALAEQLAALARNAVAGIAPPGIYHGTAGGEVSWCGLAKAVFTLSGLDSARIRPVSSAYFPRPARRPAYSVLCHDRWAAAGVTPQPHWHDQLVAALAQGGL
jgi:dTDP-4-dehydrorhamnose reductase